MTVTRPRPSSTRRSPRSLATITAASFSLTAVASFGIAPLLAPAAAGSHERSHRVVVCHWVPAHGGSYVGIVVDEEGLNGHDRHGKDLVGPRDDLGFDCDDLESDEDGDDRDNEDGDDRDDEDGDDRDDEDGDDRDDEDGDDRDSEDGDEEPTPEVTPIEEPTPEVTATQEPTPEVTPTQGPTPEVTPIEGPTPEVTPIEEPTPEVTATQEPTPEVTPTAVEVDPAPVSPTDPTDPTDPTEPFVPTDTDGNPTDETGTDDSTTGSTANDPRTSSSGLPTALAQTGSPAAQLALVGAGLVAAGTFAMVAGHRRREV